MSSSSAPPSIGFLLVNLGTPEAPTPRAVRAYLNEFLMDPYVVTLPWVLRRILVSCFILPFRPRKSAEAYAKIWTAAGAPLLVHSLALEQAMQAELQAPVALAMRYGNPSLADGLDRLADNGARHVVVAPLYPQYAESTVRTTLEAVATINTKRNAPLDLTHVPPFYSNESFIEALAQTVQPYLQSNQPYDHVLMSYHGLPEAHLKKADPTGRHCLADTSCCDTLSPAHATCYRHQAFTTSRALAQHVGWQPEDYSITFQSRLGRQPWLQPYTDVTLTELPKRGVTRLLVICPAFVADNLETLEEIAIQGRETFLNAGGEHLDVVPCLNTDPMWVRALADLLKTTASHI